MGMAASQARLIELTSRKTDVEYQGQQINQQRTMLANESAEIFSELMNLQVPTAPSSTDYTTTSYTFSDGTNKCTINDGGISALTGDPEYNAKVTYSYPTTNYKSMDKVRTDLTINRITDGTTTTYWVGNTKLSTVSTTNTTSTTTTTDKTALTQIDKDFAGRDIATDIEGNNPIYKYSSGNTSYYLSSTEIDNLLITGSISTTSSTTTTSYTGTLNNYYAADITSNITTTEKAYVTYSSSGRASNVQLASISGSSFDLTATSTTNENAYNDAVNEYEYQQQQYEQKVTNLNAKTSTVEAQDRVLEMKLKQLDTEQEALQTELDSVKKVIDKNIEQTFKTFSS